MKTESKLEICATCATRYDPASSSAECPHPATTESATLRQMREGGKPYKHEAWKVPAWECTEPACACHFPPAEATA